MSSHEDVTGTIGFTAGTHRTVPPAVTLARLAPLLPQFGITRVANLTGLDRVGIPVVMVCRPNSRSSAVFHGKGLDLAAAKASGVMEAVETWHAEHAQAALRFGSPLELGRTLPLADIARLPRAQTGEPDGHLSMLWAEGEELLGGGKAWVPYEMVHADGTAAALPGSGSFAASTNGLASGNTRLEALSHALCELIERDASSLWHRRSFEERQRARLDLATVADAACRLLLRRLEEAELEVGVWETTSDIGVPAFECMLLDRSGDPGHVGRGAGCHASPRIALARALTEAAQVRMTYIVGSREDIRRVDYKKSAMERMHLWAQALLRPVERPRRFASEAGAEAATFADEVAWLLRRLRAAGMSQAIAVDLTRPEFGIAVVRAVVPGLEGTDNLESYVPGLRAQAIAGLGR